MNRAPDFLFCEPRYRAGTFFPTLAYMIGRAGKQLSFVCLAIFVSGFPVYAQGDSGNPGSKNFQDRIHFGDVVDVDVVGSVEFDWRGGLTPEGFLDGLERADKPVYALCRTEDDVAAAIIEQYRRVLRNPTVIVRIVDRSKRALAYLNGAVRKPQRFQIRRAVSLIELIVLSGGITDSSNGEIVIFRPPNVNCPAVPRSDSSNEGFADRKPQVISVKIADLLAGDPKANLLIVSGDIVTVAEAPPVFLIGDVAAPRRMNLTPELTLSRAIASAGGLLRTYSDQKIRIHRRGSSTGVLEFDLRKILDKKEEDPKLQPYDVVDVEQKGLEGRRIAPIPEPRNSSESMSKLPLRIID